MVLAIERRIDRDEPSVGREFDQPPAALLRAVELAAGAMGQSIHAISVAAEFRDRPGLRIEVKDQPIVDRR